MNEQIKKIKDKLENQRPYYCVGKVLSSRGTVYEARLSKASIGSSIVFVTEDGCRVDGEVVSIKGDHCCVMPYDDVKNINTNTKIYLTDDQSHIGLSPDLLGRVVDFRAKPIDSKGEISIQEKRSIFGKPLNPMDRTPVHQALDVGVNAINGFCTIGRGQRMSILAGSGVGKSVLMGMMAKQTEADVIVIALVGERGREVLDFIETELGSEGLKKAILVVATSDTSPLMKIRAAYTATTIAEYFRDGAKNVLLMMDSITRFAMAYREIGMSVGEPIGPKGYGPTVFSKLPKLMERAGTVKTGGSITGIYTVLVEGGDMDEPIADAVRSISDGHIVLSRELAAKDHYPAIDILNSLSRVMNKVITREHSILSSHLRDLLAEYRKSEDLINIGAYVKGSNPKLDKAVAVIEEINNVLKQRSDQAIEPQELIDKFIQIARNAEEAINPNAFSEAQA